MVDQEDVYLTIKVNHNGESKEFISENLPSLDELKCKIMGYLSIPDIKKYMHFSYKNEEGQNNIIEKQYDLFKFSNQSQGNNGYYIELDLSVDNEINKIKQFMNSVPFISNNNNKINSDNNIQKMNEKEKKNELKEKGNEEIKKLKMEELEKQINEIKKRRQQKEKIKDMNNKLSKNIENIIKMKKELDNLKINNFMNEFKNKIIKDIIPFIKRNISNYIKNKKYEIERITAEDIINIIKQNISNKKIDYSKKQNDEKRLKVNYNFEGINKDIDDIKNEINNINKNKVKNSPKELQNNNNNKRMEKVQINEIFNNETNHHMEVKKDKNKLPIRDKRKTLNDNLSFIKTEQNNELKKVPNNNIINQFSLLLEEIFCNNFSILSNSEKNKIEDYSNELKSLNIEPLKFVLEFYNKKKLLIKSNINKNNYNEDKLKIIKQIIINLNKSNNSNKEKIIINKGNFRENEKKIYMHRKHKIQKEK